MCKLLAIVSLLAVPTGDSKQANDGKQLTHDYLLILTGAVRFSVFGFARQTPRTCIAAPQWLHVREMHGP